MGKRSRIRRFNRKAVSTMIGGIIVLSLFLTALTAMVVVSQQYDSYQSVVDIMSQKEIDRFSENLIANYPGLARTSPTGGIACTGSVNGQSVNLCNQYDMTVSNVGGLSNAGSVGGTLGGSSGSGGGGVAIQIVRIYINSTTWDPSGGVAEGCSLPKPGGSSTTAYSPCVLSSDPGWFGASPTYTPIAFTFRSTDALINPGEYNHIVRFWLPCVTSCSTTAILLPGEGGTTPENSIWIITARGRSFTFQWPFPQAGPSQTSAVAGTAINSGTMRIAYAPTSGSYYDSAQEPFGQSYPPTGTWPYCHTEPLWSGTLPAGVGYAEKLTGITNLATAGVPSSYGTTLTFVNPWTNFQILQESNEAFFIYVKALNPYQRSITIAGGTLVAQGASWKPGQAQAIIIGNLLGTLYVTSAGVWSYVAQGTSWGSASIPPTTNPANPSWFYLIFYVAYINIQNQFPTNVPSSWVGTAALSNEHFGTDTNYFGGEFLLDGLLTVPNTNSQGSDVCPTSVT